MTDHPYTGLSPFVGPPLDPPRYPLLGTLLPPAEFWARDSTELALLIEDDELWIFVQAAADEHDAFEQVSSDLLIQLKTVHQLAISVRQTLSAASGHGLSDSQIQVNREALAGLCQIHGTSTAPGLSCTMSH